MNALNCDFETVVYRDVERAVNDLRLGLVVAIPTETVYGLAGNAFLESTVENIFLIKERPRFDPLIVHVPPCWLTISDLTRRGLVAGEILPEPLFQALDFLMSALMPGPLTLLMPKGPRIPNIVTSGRSLVGIRSPSHRVTRSLLEKLDLPLAAPSANRFGHTSPTRAHHVQLELNKKVHAILDGGDCSIGLESTVAVLNQDLSVSILRPGAVSEVHFAKFGFAVSYAQSAHKASSPGMLDRHYAPQKRFVVANCPESLQKILEQERVDHVSLLIPDTTIKNFQSWKKIIDDFEVKNIYELEFNPLGDRAALRFFDLLHEYNLDTAKSLLVSTPILQTTGLWGALSDRLARAASKE